MIVGGYELHLYCDGCDRNKVGNRLKPDVYTGETGPECRKQARKDGWKIDLKRMKCWCRECVKKGDVKQGKRVDDA